MVNETILGGLRIAISHKSSLKDAMQSFYNANYDKKEIEEAAKIIFDEQIKQPKPLSPEDLKKTIKGLYQAGYKKEGIQKTAEELAQPITTKNNVIKKVEKKSFFQKLFQKKQEIKNQGIKSSTQPLTKSLQVQQKPEIKKEIPKKKPSNKNMGVIILLAGVLFILLVALIALFIFKDKIF